MWQERRFRKRWAGRSFIRYGKAPLSLRRKSRGHAHPGPLATYPLCGRVLRAPCGAGELRDHVCFIAPENARTLHAPLRALPAPWRVLATIDRGRAFPDLATLIPWFAPLWLAGVCLFYLWRHTAGWIASFRLRRRGVCHAPDSWQRYIEHLGLELKSSGP